MIRFVVRWLLPGGLILAAAVAFDRFASAELAEEVARGYPEVALVATVLLAWIFHRSRVALVAVGLAALLLIQGRMGSGPVLEAATMAVLLVMGGLAVTRDRGVRSPGGLGQAFLAMAAGGAVTAALLRAPERAARILSATPMPDDALAWTGLPQLTVVAVILAAVPVTWGALVRGGPVERGFLWLMPLLVLALHPSTPTMETPVFLMAGAVLLGSSVVETSYAMAYLDDLTGLPGRRALDRDMDVLPGQWTAAMVDVDHFKRFNDRHGHDVGDQVLRMVAARLAGVRGGARAYRYGGEEFTLLFPGKGKEQAMPYLERVRASVADSNFTLRSWRRPRKRPEKPRGGRTGTDPDRRLSVTISIGVAEAGPDDADAEDVLERADKAMYRAKKRGRNRIAG